MADSLEIVVPGEPRGKGRPRFARAGGFVRTYTDAKTASYESVVKHEGMLAMGDRPLYDGALMVTVEARMSVPASWSQKRQRAALDGAVRPTGRPDADNLVKVLDALNKIVWRDDAQIVELAILKRYASTPALRILVAPARSALAAAPAVPSAPDLLAMVG